MESQLKVSRAVTRLSFQKPFWGSMALASDIHEDNNIGTWCTDGLFIKWNDAFTQRLDEEETEFVLAHEISHIMWEHCQEFEGKDPRKVNKAQDYIINAMLKEAGFKLIQGCLYDPQYDGMTWQQVYAQLPEDGGDDDALGGDVQSNPDLSDAEKEELKQEVRRRVVQAAENAKAQGVGDLPEGIEGLIKEIRESKVDWKEMIRTNIKNNFPDDYTMRKPNKKFLDTYKIYMPTMYSETIGTLAIGLDTSGSMCNEDHIKILSEINAISLELKPQKILLFYTDCEVANVEEYEFGEEIDVLKTRGGGGTSFVPVFKYIEDNGIEVDQLLYMSDMEVWDDCFPKFAPDYPVLWISTRDDYNVPFGEVVRVKD